MLGVEIRAKRLSWIEVGDALSQQISKILKEPLVCKALPDDAHYWDVKFPKPGLSLAQISALLESVGADEDMHVDSLSFASDQVTTSTSLGMSLADALLKQYLQADWDAHLANDESLCLIGVSETPKQPKEPMLQLDNKTIHFSALKTKEELMRYLEENGASHTSLMDFCEPYMEQYENELCWPYPISDGKHHGTFLVLVREGILSLPYDEMDKEDYELFCPEDARLFQCPEDMQVFIDDWHYFDMDLKQAMHAMFRYLKEQEDAQNE